MVILLAVDRCDITRKFCKPHVVTSLFEEQCHVMSVLVRWRWNSDLCQLAYISQLITARSI